MGDSQICNQVEVNIVITGPKLRFIIQIYTNAAKNDQISKVRFLSMVQKPCHTVTTIHLHQAGN